MVCEHSLDRVPGRYALRAVRAGVVLTCAHALGAMEGKIGCVDGSCSAPPGGSSYSRYDLAPICNQGPTPPPTPPPTPAPTPSGGNPTPPPTPNPSPGRGVLQAQPCVLTRCCSVPRRRDGLRRDDQDGHERRVDARHCPAGAYLLRSHAGEHGSLLVLALRPSTVARTTSREASTSIGRALRRRGTLTTT